MNRITMERLGVFLLSVPLVLLLALAGPGGTARADAPPPTYTPAWHTALAAGSLWGEWTGGPVLTDTSVILIGPGGLIQAYSVADGKLLWQQQATRPGGEGLTYDQGFIAYRDDGALMVRSARDGSLVWSQTPTGSSWVPAPIIRSGKVIIPGDDLPEYDLATGQLIAKLLPGFKGTLPVQTALDGDQLIMITENVLHGVNLANGTSWSATGDFWQLAVANHTVYAYKRIPVTVCDTCPSDVKLVLATFTTEGNLLWQLDVPSGVTAGFYHSLAADDQGPVISGMYALAAATGQHTWTQSANGEPYVAVSRQNRLIRYGEAQLQVLDRPTGALLSTYRLPDFPDVPQPRGIAVSPDSQTVAVWAHNDLWLFRLSDTPVQSPDVLIFSVGSEGAKYNGQAVPMAYDSIPFLKDDRTFVALRWLGETLGARITWEPETQTVTYQRGGHVVNLRIGSIKAQVDGVTVTLDTAPVIQNERTFVPLRFVAEGLGAQVDWDARQQAVLVAISPN